MTAIEELVRARVAAPRQDAASAFARAYLRRARSDGRVDPEALAAELLGVFELASSRRGPAAVRAINPTRAAHGYEAAGSVVETSAPDAPFLVDSVSAELRSRGLGIARIVHPVIGVERDGDGTIERVAAPGEAPAAESVMHFELDRRLDDAELATLAQGVDAVLADVRRVVRDFAAMRERLHELEARVDGADPDAVAEARAFLRWLDDDHFIYLGALDLEQRGRALAAVPGSGLGLLDGADRAAIERLDALGPPASEEPLVVAKSHALAPVHRRVRMDRVLVRRAGGAAVLLGLLTTRAYAEPAAAAPLLAGKLARIVAQEQLAPGSHDYKAAVALFESFPRDELFAAPVEDLRRAIVALLTAGAGRGRAAGPPIGRRPLGGVRRCDPAGALRRRAARAPACAAGWAPRGDRGRRARGARRGRSRARPPQRASRRRPARGGRPGSAARCAGRAHAQLGRPRPRAPGGGARRGARGRARAPLGPRGRRPRTRRRSSPRPRRSSSRASTRSSARRSRSWWRCATSAPRTGRR